MAGILMDSSAAGTPHGQGACGTTHSSPVPKLAAACHHSVERKPQTISKWLYQDVRPNAEAAAFERRNLERAGDASTPHAGRRTQRERKEIMVEGRPNYWECYWAVVGHSAQAQLESEFEALEHGLQRADQPPQAQQPRVPKTPPPACLEQHGSKKKPTIAGEQKQPVLAKVERCHREMVRREVWRQKFDFIYRQVTEKELREEPGDTHRHPSTCSSPNSSAHGSVEMPELLAVQQLQQGRPATTGRMSTLPGSAASPAKAARSGHGSAPQAAPRHRGQASRLRRFAASPHSKQAGLEKAPFANSTLPVEAKETKAAPHICAGWRKTGSLRHVDIPRCQTASGSKRVPGGRSCTDDYRGANEGSSGAACSPSTGKVEPMVVHSILQASASLPLLPSELKSVRDEYYGGDELLLHEDILYSSNPHLFPLRVGSRKAFPMTSLDPIGVF